MKNVKFRGKKTNSAVKKKNSAAKDEFRGKFRGSNSAEKTKIPRYSVYRGKLWALLIRKGLSNFILTLRTQ